MSNNQPVDSGTPEIPVEIEGFSWEKERKTEYTERTDFVILKDFGEKGRSVKYFVKGLTGPQRAAADEMGAFTPDQIQSMFTKLLKAVGQQQGAIDQVFDLLPGMESGQAATLPPSYLKIMKIFQFGSVGLSDDDDGWNETLKFFTRHYIDAIDIVQKIQEVSALGWEAKKKP